MKETKIPPADALWRIPAQQALLLMREDARCKGDQGMTLEDMEVIDRWQTPKQYR